MARYIEANDLVRKMTLQANRSSLGEIVPPSLSYSEMLEIIADAPTADVVPKTEVALDVIRKIKNKVRKYKQNVVNPYEHIILYLNELEKKYTEGEA